MPLHMPSLFPGGYAGGQREELRPWQLRTEVLILLNCGAREVLRVPWTARRSNQSVLREISPEYSLEGLMLKLKLQYFSHLMQKTDSLEKTPILAKIEGTRRRGYSG